MKKSAPEKPRTGVLKKEVTGSQKWGTPVLLFILFALLTSVLLAFNFTVDLRAHEFHVGEPAPRTLFSPYEILFVNEAATSDLKKTAMEGVPSVYRKNADIKNQITARIDDFFETLNAERSAQEGAALVDPATALPVSSETVSYLSKENALEDVRKQVQLLLERTLPRGILSDEAIDRAALNAAVVTLIGEQEEQVSPTRFLTLAGAQDIAGQALNESAWKRGAGRAALLDIFQTAIKPNLSYDETETKARRKAAAGNVKPVEQSIKEDELIIQRGMIVSPAEKLKIDQIQKKRQERFILRRISGTSLISLITFSALFAYLFFFYRKILLSARMVLLFHSVFLVSIFLCKVVRYWPDSSPYLMPGALASLLLALLVNPRFGAVAAIVMAALIAPLADFQPDVVLSALLSGTVGTLAAFKVRKRMEFLRVGLVVGAVTAGVIFASRLLQEYGALESAQIAGLGFVNGLLITMPFLFLLLAFFETFFNLATDITLLELSDLNHPLLKRMIIEAPGTYHHSLVVSRLSESAAEEIGANALLARVGAYFHDIGKIARSEFFTENKKPSVPSRHEKLTPTMSSLIIISHVKDGIELGKKYKLKQSVLNFIPEHQGTGVVYYFYRKALDQAVPGERINPDDYRYPGPKPQTRETAITLLADSTEAAARSLKDPTPESLRQLVRKIINDKFIDGQLDECDLTLKDLYRIQESFVRDLLAINHTRVPYPEKPEDAGKPDLFSGERLEKYRVK